MFLVLSTLKGRFIAVLASLAWVFGRICVDQHDKTILSRAEMLSIPGE